MADFRGRELTGSQHTLDEFRPDEVTGVFRNIGDSNDDIDTNRKLTVGVSDKTATALKLDIERVNDLLQRYSVDIGYAMSTQNYALLLRRIRALSDDHLAGRDIDDCIRVVGRLLEVVRSEVAGIKTLDEPQFPRRIRRRMVKRRVITFIC